VLGTRVADPHEPISYTLVSRAWQHSSSRVRPGAMRNRPAGRWSTTLCERVNGCSTSPKESGDLHEQ
jgi:hypothetical protein